MAGVAFPVYALEEALESEALRARRLAFSDQAQVSSDRVLAACSSASVLPSKRYSGGIRCLGHQQVFGELRRSAEGA